MVKLADFPDKQLTEKYTQHLLSQHGPCVLCPLWVRPTLPSIASLDTQFTSDYQAAGNWVPYTASSIHVYDVLFPQRIGRLSMSNMSVVHGYLIMSCKLYTPCLPAQ